MDMLRILLIFFIFISPAFAQKMCPYGIIHDEYPGQCGLYQDNNKNGICDRSEESLKLMKEKETRQAASLHPDDLPKVSTNPPPAVKAAVYDPANVAPRVRASPEIFPRVYALPLIMALTVLFLLASDLLERYYPWHARMIRFFWNWVLLAAFVITGLSGIWIVSIYGFRSPLKPFFYSLHIQAGTVVFIVGLHHFIRRIRAMIRPQSVKPPL